MKKNILAYIVFIVLLYMILFDPPFLFFRGLFSPSNVIILFSCFFALLRPNVIRTVLHDYKNIVTLFAFLFLYVVFRSGIEGETSTISEHLLAIVSMFVTVPVLLDALRRNGYYSAKDVIKAILVTSSIASVITLLCIISPEFGAYIKYEVMQVSQDTILFDLDYRGFGFGNQLTSTYGYIQGLCFALGLFYLKDNKWVLFFLPLIFISALLNARTGALIAVVGFVIYLVSSFSLSKGLLILTTSVVVISLSYSLIVKYLGLSQETIDWLLNFSEQMEAVAEERDLGAARTTYLLFDEMWILPESLEEWIIGKGYSIYLGSEKVSKTSDVGWIVQLNYGGLIYMVLLLVAFWNLFKKIHKKGDRRIFYLLVISFVILNSKCSIYPRVGLIPLFMILFYLTTDKRYVTNNHQELLLRQ